MPRGSMVRIGSVDSGQSMVRPTTTASLLLFQSTRVQASAMRGAARIAPAAAAATRAALRLNSCITGIALGIRASPELPRLELHDALARQRCTPTKQIRCKLSF
jgi:hypothetical protein